MTRALAVLAAVLAAAALAGPARAHEDPASDYLVGHAVFLPFEARFTPALRERLLGLVARADERGYRIRVAVVTGPSDLGEVPRFWRRPRAWAPFLAGELRSYYRGPLLVVMPNGFGTANMPAAAARLLRRIAIRPGPDGLLRATETAVERLAAAQGVHVSPPARVTTPAQRNARDRIHLVLGAAVLLAAGVLLRLALRRRAATA